MADGAKSDLMILVIHPATNMETPPHHPQVMSMLMLKGQQCCRSSNDSTPL